MRQAIWGRDVIASLLSRPRPPTGGWGTSTTLSLSTVAAPEEKSAHGPSSRFAVQCSPFRSRRYNGKRVGLECDEISKKRQFGPLTGKPEKFDPLPPSGDEMRVHNANFFGLNVKLKFENK